VPPPNLMEELERIRRSIAANGPAMRPEEREHLETLFVTVQDQVLASIQRQVVDSAKGDLGVGEGIGDDGQSEQVLEYVQGIGWSDASVAPGGNIVFPSDGVPTPFQWCGAFAGYHYIETAGLDPDLSMSFSSGRSMHHFFEYGSFDDRNPGAILVDGVWTSIEEYHGQRDSPRQWWNASDIATLVADGGWAALPIRRGDVVIVDHRDGGGARDHVAMVQRFDRETGTLVTLDGNSYNESVRSNDRSSDLDNSAHPAVPSSGNRIYGIGRPSIVDFEVHEYRISVPAPTGD